jgi:hypothetical protein
MSKKAILQAKDSKLGKTSSHTGKEPLVPHINDSNVMVRKKVRRAQESNRNGR